MNKKTQKFDPRKNMNSETFEVFHYLDIKTRHMEAHYHDFYEVFCFVDGEVDYWIEGSVYHLKPGDILLINPTELHKPIARKNTENYERMVLWINKNYLSDIENGLLESCFDTKSKTYKKIMRPTALQKKEMLTLFNSILKEYNSQEFASGTASYGVLLQIMALLNRISLGSSTTVSEKYRTKTLISDVLTYIGEHYNEELSLEMLSKHFFTSKYYLSHEFSSAVGTSIHRYITLKRLNIAHQMLREGVSAGQACILCGFKDYTNFFRAFKAEYGVSPRECTHHR